jgi:hypothetical protein
MSGYGITLGDGKTSIGVRSCKIDGIPAVAVTFCELSEARTPGSRVSSDTPKIEPYFCITFTDKRSLGSLIRKCVDALTYFDQLMPEISAIPPTSTNTQINATIYARDGSEYDQRQGVPNV